MATNNAMSDYLENKVLNDNLTNVYIGLFLSNPNETNSGTEVSGGGYERQSIPFTISSNQAQNGTEVSFPQATADWGVLTHFGIYDASTGGNLLFYGALEDEVGTNSTFTVNNGDTIKFPANSLTITLD